MNTIKTPFFHGFTFIYVAAASAFLVLMAMDKVGIGRTVLKDIPVSTLMVLMLRDMRGFARICLTGASSVHELSASIDKVSEHTNVFSETAHETASSIEERVSTIKSIAESLDALPVCGSDRDFD